MASSSECFEDNDRCCFAAGVDVAVLESEVKAHKRRKNGFKLK